MTKQSAENPSRYRPVYVAIHWIMALMIFGSLASGMFMLAPMPNSEAKLAPLGFHAVWGGTIGLLFVIRLVLRARMPRPAPADSGSPLLDVLAKMVHFLLYVGIFGMLLSGAGIAQLADLFAVFRGNAPFPESFFAFPPRMGHNIFAIMMWGLVLAHTGAALYHQFIKKDNLLGRMWFGKS
jgi:cytochrome b561